MVRLASLTPEELYVLLTNIRAVQAGGDPLQYLVPDEGLQAFMRHCSEVVGEAYFRTPRATVRAFVQFLAVLEQNPGADWQSLVGEVVLTPDEDEHSGRLPDEDEPEDGDELAEFRL